MLATIRPRLTFANVCSFLALLIALSTGGAYAANSISSSDIVNGEVKTKDLAGDAVTGKKLHNNAVHGQDLAAGAVDSTKILDGSITLAELADGSVNSAKVAGDSLTASDLAAGSVGTAEVADGSIANVDLAGTAVTGAKVVNESLTTADIAGAASNGAVSLSGISNGRCSQVTLNVSGAQVGEVPLVATGAPIQNGVLLYAQRVESEGHVEVNACNFSGTAMTPISGLPVRVITFG